MNNRCRIQLSLFTLFLAFTVPALPQASTGSVKGTVRDATTAVVANAALELTNTATNVSARTTTNEAGFYIFPGVVPGQYRLTAEAAGFERFEVR